MTSADILKALSNVQEPDLGKDLVTLNMIKDLQVDGDKVSFTIVLTTPACPMKDLMKNACENAIKLLDENESQILIEAGAITEKLYKKIPVIYAESSYEGVAVRFRQQINENSKMLCWHHVVPEMNHNELVGWRKKDPKGLIAMKSTDPENYKALTDQAGIKI